MGSPTKRQRSTADVLESQNFRLSAYSDPNRLDYDEELMHLQAQFNRLFKIVEESIPQVGTACNRYSFTCGSLNLCHVLVSNTISAESEDCRESGWIACNSVLSGLYAKGITRCDRIMMSLVMSLDINDKLRDKVIDEIVEGFKDCARSVGVKVTNSPLTTGPYVTIGGTVSTTCYTTDFMDCGEAQPGDVLVLTKPLGSLVAVRCKDDHVKPKLEEIDSSLAEHAYKMAIQNMKQSNKNASIFMKRYNAHAAIDINGYSLIYSACELAKIQKRSVSFEIDKLPILKYTDTLDKYLNTGLVKGVSQELCGGFLISFHPDFSEDFVREQAISEGCRCFYVGKVVEGSKTATIVDDARIISVDLFPEGDVPTESIYL